MTFVTFQSVNSFLGDLELNPRTACVIVAAVVCVIAPLDLTQLIFALLGALVYAALQAFGQAPTKCQLEAEREQRQRPMARGGIRKQCNRDGTPIKGEHLRPRPTTFLAKARPSNSAPAAYVVKRDVYQPSSVPVIAQKFQSTGWEDEVTELIAQIMPGVDENKAVQQLVRHVKETIQALLPEVEVMGFAHGSLKSGKAFGCAVPEVDITANVNPILLAQRFKQHKSMDLKKLHKSAIRMCCDRLVSAGGLKFRRSAFRGEEPRVTLLVPTSLGIFTDPVPVDFTINAVTPLYTSALLTECGQFEPRAKALILFVKRWAKDRGICHAAKGHLPPYLWSLLVVYFLQVGVEEEGPLLPTVEAFAISSAFSKQSSSGEPTSKQQPTNTSSADNATKASIGQLFCEFVHFYSQRFNWRNEAVSVRTGQRAPPSISLPLHVVLDESANTSDVAITIEDPFKAGNNLGTCMNAMSMARLREELARASQLCTRSASLTELLQPWVPSEDAPERGSGSSPDEEGGDSKSAGAQS